MTRRLEPLTPELARDRFLAAKIERLEARVTALEAAIDKVRELHRGTLGADDLDHDQLWCKACSEDWPCLTIGVIDREESAIE